VHVCWCVALERCVPTEGAQDLAEGSTLTLVAKHADGSTDEIPLTHTFNAPQIAWFKAGSALNLSRRPTASPPSHLN